VQGETHLVPHPGVEDHAEGLPRLRPGGGHAGHGAVVLRQGLDVEADPVDQREELGEAPRVRAAGVQAHLEAEVAHAGHRRGERQLAGGLASGEHHAVEQATPPRQEGLDVVVPADDPGDRAVDERGVVAVGTVPRAALAEHRGHQPARPVHARERDEPGDREVVRTRAHAPQSGDGGDVGGQRRGHRWASALSSVNITRSAYSPFLPMLKEDTGRKYPMTRVHTSQACGASGRVAAHLGQVWCSPAR